MAESEVDVELVRMIWDGTGNLGVGTVFLKALVILVLGAVFWVVCELIKYLVNVLSKLAVAALRYLAIAVRGWPPNGEGGEESGRGEQRQGEPWVR